MCGLTKKDLRAHYLLKRQQVSPGKREAWSLKMQEAVLRLVEEKNIETVMLYAAFRGEPETEQLARRLLQMDKRVALPKCGKEGSMEAFLISRWEELIPGAYGILEPPTERRLRQEEQSLIIVPGCAFAADGTRLGYGGGFYDRYLPACKSALKVGYCYSVCLAESLPLDNFDVKMDAVITENGLVNKV